MTTLPKTPPLELDAAIANTAALARISVSLALRLAGFSAFPIPKTRLLRVRRS
jgi:hypothetical protein